MRLEFLGTRGGIRARSRLHRRHSALLITHRGHRIMIDAGDDWRGRLEPLAPDAILVTHGHPDHAGSLRAGSPCPVWATPHSWRGMHRLPISRRELAPRRETRIAGLAVTAIAVVHSTRFPAVGYRIRGGRTTIFYVPDVIALPPAVLAGVDLYVGDGARITRPLIRILADGSRAGHTSIAAQIAWCARAGVAHAIFTHCGTEIVRGDPRRVAAKVAALGELVGVTARLAHDGLVWSA